MKTTMATNTCLNLGIARLVAWVVAPLLLLLLVSSCNPRHTPGGTDPLLPTIAVETLVVKSEELPVYDEVVGTVRPHLEARVSAKVTGRIVEMLAVPGMKVKKGKVLARIEVEELKAALERAQASKENAARDLDRYRQLLSTGAATQAEFDAIQMKQRMDAATVKETEVMIANASVQAPFDGTVTRKFLDTGDLASPGRVLFSIEDSSLLRLEIHVAESLASRVSLGDTFRVRVEGAAADLKGKVGEISPAADPGSRTFSVKLELEKDQALRAGQFGRAYMPRAQRLALRVPEAAMIQRGQMDYVFVADEGVARLRIVRALDGSGQAAGEGTPREILAGIEDGETLVLSPPPGLRDGQAVDISAIKPQSGDPAGKNR
jgi:RND family efflux transporter MFP subunit